MVTNLRSFPALRQVWDCIPTNLLKTRNTTPAISRLFSTDSRRSSQDSPSSTIPLENSSPNSTLVRPVLTHLNKSGDAHMVSISSKIVTKRTATAVCNVNFSNPFAATLIHENRAKKGDVFAVARVAGIMAAKRTVDLIPLCHPVPISHVAISLSLQRWIPQVSPMKESTQAEAVQDSQPWAGTGQGDAYKWHSKTMSTPGGDEDKSQQGATQRTTLTPKEGRVQQQADGTRRYWVAINATVECDGKTGVEMEALTAASVAALTVYDMCKAVDKGMRIEGLRVAHKEGGKSGTWREGVSVG